MKHLVVLSFLILFVNLGIAQGINKFNIINYVSNTTCYVENEGAVSSGVFFTHGNRNFVITASHCVTDDNYLMGDLIFVGKIYNNISNSTINDVSSLAKILLIDTNKDLCLLEISSNFGITNKIYFHDFAPQKGDEVINMGNYGGRAGYASFTKGFFSNYNRKTELGVLDQVDISITFGCSGSGVFLTDGKFIGIVMGKLGNNMAMIVPSRTIKEWLTKNNYSFLLNE